ncbi:Ig-like domain repeat protein [Leucobacter allii]|nr:Ig-like domain repeat protein [Leucobacter allii]UOR01565.1 Ig-like domain repeat protein [Leucobacter allii]
MLTFMRGILGVVAAFALVLSGLVVSAPARALEVAEPRSVSLGCANFGYSYGTWTFDRDNTGSGVEAYRVRVVDGAGTVLFATDSAQPLSTVPGLSSSTAYHALPQYNPLRFSVVSASGNGFPEQLVWEATGSCSGLPDADLPPSATPMTFGAELGSPLSDTLARFVTDPEGADLDFSVSEAPTLGALELASDGAFTYTPQRVGSDSAIVTVTDPGHHANVIDVEVTFATTESSTVQLRPSAESIAFGDPLSLHAELVAETSDADLSGSIAFTADGVTIGTASVDPETGTAALPGVALALGAHELGARFTGNSTTRHSEAAPVTVTVSPAATATSLSVSPDPITVGETATLTAVVSGTAPSGEVEFFDGATSLGTAPSPRGRPHSRSPRSPSGRTS